MQVNIALNVQSKATKLTKRLHGAPQGKKGSVAKTAAHQRTPPSAYMGSPAPHYHTDVQSAGFEKLAEKATMATSDVDAYRRHYIARAALAHRLPLKLPEIPYSVLLPRQLLAGERAILEVRFVAMVQGCKAHSVAYTVLNGVGESSNGNKGVLCAPVIVIVKPCAPIEIVGSRLVAFDEVGFAIANQKLIREGMHEAMPNLARLQQFRRFWPPFRTLDTGMHGACMVVLRNFAYASLPWLQRAPDCITTKVRSVQDFPSGCILFRLADTVTQ